MVLTTLGIANAAAMDRPTLVKHLDDNKTTYAAELATQLQGNSGLAARMPQAFRDAISELCELA